MRGERVNRCSEITWTLLIPHEPGSIVPYNNQLVYQGITGLIPTHEIQGGNWLQTAVKTEIKTCLVAMVDLQ